MGFTGLSRGSRGRADPRRITDLGGRGQCSDCLCSAPGASAAFRGGGRGRSPARPLSPLRVEGLSRKRGQPNASSSFVDPPHPQASEAICKVLCPSHLALPKGCPNVHLPLQYPLSAALFTWSSVTFGIKLSLLSLAHGARHDLVPFLLCN